MAITDDDRREYLRNNVTSDLQYVWDDAEIPLTLQYDMAQHYKSLRVFTALGENSADVRTAVQADFNLDPARDPAVRAQVAQVVAAWNAGKELYTKEKEIQAESKVLGVPRHLQHSERLAMLKAVEKVLGHLTDHETPSAEYLALKVEECENGECTAASLDEVSSKADRNTSALQTSLDSTGHVRITKTKSKGRLPETTEEYRKLMKLEATTWLCMSSKFKSKHFLAGLKMEDFNRFVEFVLGEKVHGIKVPVDGQQQPLRPPFALVLQFEHRLRREAFKLVNKGEKTLAEALEAVTKDAELKESYFTTPLALTNHDPARHGGQRSYNNPYDNKKGKSKGFGKAVQGGAADYTSVVSKAVMVNTPPGNTIVAKIFQRAAAKQSADVKHYLQEFGLEHGFSLHVTEVDVERSNLQLAQDHNYLVDQTIATAHKCFQCNADFLIEHPEDLGACHGEWPASIWQWETMQQLQQATKATTWAVFQCHFDAPSPKPTRFLSTLKPCQQLPHATWPVFDEGRQYLGPLPTSCGHSTHAKRLLGQLPSGKWATEGSAAYPPALCKYLAELIASRVGSTQASSLGSDAGTKPTTTIAADSSPTRAPAETGQTPATTTAADSPDLGTVDSDTNELPTQGGPEEARNRGKPLVVEWGGRAKPFVDGFGLCSANRWRPE
ncbi:unnamed protein product [Cladocopium goreaui]|uniref:Uncharacterized protein n=1 Tax=Cladocopium goreaui TaxID=2562237 RepID=A0A9P1CDK8_9DINO|nr:unnamed protein product [Cladocopium goreaui]